MSHDSESKASRCYEIINPSDKATMLASSDQVAIASVVIISRLYGVEDVDDPGRKIGHLYGFLGDGARAQLDKDLGQEFEEFLANHKPEIIEALRSIQLMSGKERKAYDEAIRLMTPENARIYAEKVKEIHRSSLTDFAAAAWVWADRWEKMGA